QVSSRIRSKGRRARRDIARPCYLVHAFEPPVCRRCGQQPDHGIQRSRQVSVCLGQGRNRPRRISRAAWIGGDANGDIFVSNYWGPARNLPAMGSFCSNSPCPIRTASLTPTGMNSDRWGDAYIMARDKTNRAAIVKYNNNGTLVTTWPRCAL